MIVHYSSDGITTACGTYAIGKHTNDESKVTCKSCKAAQQGVEPTVDGHSEPTFHPIRMDGKQA
jgi:hypothetical protein